MSGTVIEEYKNLIARKLFKNSLDISDIRWYSGSFVFMVVV